MESHIDCKQEEKKCWNDPTIIGVCRPRGSCFNSCYHPDASEGAPVFFFLVLIFNVAISCAERGSVLACTLSTPSQKGRHRCCQKRQPFRPNYLSCSSSFTVLTPIDSYETVPPRALTTASAEIVNPFLQHRRTRLILVVRSRQRTFLDPTYTYARLYEREEPIDKSFRKTWNGS